jgi:hypothetical protein
MSNEFVNAIKENDHLDQKLNDLEILLEMLQKKVEWRIKVNTELSKTWTGVRTEDSRHLIEKLTNLNQELSSKKKSLQFLDALVLEIRKNIRLQTDSMRSGI